jgi:hypothetical protein
MKIRHLLFALIGVSIVVIISYIIFTDQIDTRLPIEAKCNLERPKHLISYLVNTYYFIVKILHF